MKVVRILVSLVILSVLFLQGCSKQDDDVDKETGEVKSEELSSTIEPEKEKVDEKEKLLEISDKNLPFDKEKFEKIISEEVFYFSEYKPKEEIFDKALITGWLSHAYDENWNLYVSESFSGVEDMLGEQIPGRYPLLSWTRNSNDIEYRVLSYIGDYEKRSKVLANRFIFGIDKNTKKIVMFNDWKREPIKNLMEDRANNKADHITKLSDEYKSYVDNELEKENSFYPIDQENKNFAKQVTDMFGKMADNKIEFKDKPQMMRAPFLWGRIHQFNQDKADSSRGYIHVKESVDMNYDIIESTFFSTFESIEKHLDMEIPLREQQINWMETIEDRYFVLTEGPERKHSPYEYIVVVMDANTHEAVMLVLWNHNEPDP